MKFFSVEEIYKIDKITTKKYLIPSFVLMENAGKSVAEFITKKLNRKKKIVIFCGPGKNGGDGFVVARYLHIWGFDVEVVKFVSEKNFSGDVLLNYRILRKMGVKFIDYNKNFSIKKFDLVVDAIFGIGLNRKVEGVFLDAIENINSSRKVVVAVDIPSGINGDSGEVLGKAVKADYTITMGFMKKGFRDKVARKSCGKIVVADIGYPLKELM